MKREKGNPSSTRLWTGSIVAALIGAAFVFGVMLQMEKSTLSQFEKEKVYVAAQTIPKGQELHGDNRQQYVVLREVDKSCIPSSAIREEGQLQSLSARFSIEEGVLLTGGMFESIETITKDMKEPVITGFKADDLYQVVGGTLRPGDRIHIYRVDEAGETRLIWENVFVHQVFDYSGKSIPCEDTISAAQRINVYLDKDSMEEFYSQLALGSLRVVKAIP